MNHEHNHEVPTKCPLQWCWGLLCQGQRHMYTVHDRLILNTGTKLLGFKAGDKTGDPEGGDSGVLTESRIGEMTW